MTLDCNHDCTVCPAHVLYGGTPTCCLIINKVLAKLDYDIRLTKERIFNAEREGANK